MRHKALMAAAAIAACALAGVALADPTPVDLQATASGPAKVGLGEPFQIGLAVGVNPEPGGGPYPAPPWSLRWTATIPEGLKLVSAAWPGPVNTMPNCVTNCLYEMNDPSSRVYEYNLVPLRTGTFTFSARLTSASNPDPNHANDATSVDVAVVPLRLKLTNQAASAAHAGRRVTWTVRVSSLASGSFVRPSRASCTVRSGGKAIAAHASRSQGAAGCSWTAPSAPGTRISVTVTAGLAAATASLTRAFRVVK
jgi:hypothetical protein